MKLYPSLLLFLCLPLHGMGPFFQTISFGYKSYTRTRKNCDYSSLSPADQQRFSCTYVKPDYKKFEGMDSKQFETFFFTSFKEYLIPIGFPESYFGNNVLDQFDYCDAQHYKLPETRQKEVLGRFEFYQFPAFIEFIKTFPEYNDFITDLNQRINAGEKICSSTRECTWKAGIEFCGRTVWGESFKDCIKKLYQKIEKTEQIEQEVHKKWILQEQEKMRQAEQQRLKEEQAKTSQPMIGSLSQEADEAFYSQQADKLRKINARYNAYREKIDSLALGNSHLAARCEALEKVVNGEASIEQRNFIIDPELQEFLDDQGIDPSLFDSCEGDDLQLELHQEFINIMTEFAHINAQLTEDQKGIVYYMLSDMVEVGAKANKANCEVAAIKCADAGHAIIAASKEFGLAVFSLGKATVDVIGKVGNAGFDGIEDILNGNFDVLFDGVTEGLENTCNLVSVQTAKNIGSAVVVIGYKIGQALVEINEICTMLDDFDANAFARILQDATYLVKSADETLQPITELDNDEIFKFGVALAVEVAATQGLWAGCKKVAKAGEIVAATGEISQGFKFAWQSLKNDSIEFFSKLNQKGLRHSYAGAGEVEENSLARGMQKGEERLSKSAAEGTSKGGSAVAKNTKNGIFENASYHGKKSNPIKSKAPINGQKALDNSLPIMGNTTRRVGISHGEFVVLDETRTGMKIFHGHVRKWKDLTVEMQNALRKTGLVNRKGKILQ